ncbi:hypothetical protein MSC49_42800 (plasmid) [Methylosinus sp. C49]|uniref:thermostable hemolysin n=1 Tax=Methylosinus sp. C49 TaxID=2699395 RepID=UPI00136788EF|nr:thermostable hemolysin [Methylosinus sp. C49]BBU64345.1 hypothetical protein MSC49_42800 [Methylosinus sp. C49]
MERCQIVTLDHPRRAEAETFIRRVYRSRYGAEISVYSPILIALIDDRDGIVCAAGLRSAREGFFSESYLLAPVEQVLSKLSGEQIGRSEIFEVTTLASSAPRETMRLFCDIVAFGRESGFSWSFFTLTRRLWQLIDNLGLGPVVLGDVDPQRIDNHGVWGRYYEADPKVYAVSRRSIIAGRSSVAKTILR